MESREKLIERLKKMVIESCHVKNVNVSDISNHDRIINGEGVLRLDSLDAVEIGMAIQREFGFKVAGKEGMREAFKSFDSLADYVIANKKEVTISP